MSPTEIIRAERVNVRDVSSNAAMLHWRPVLSGLTGFYEVRFGPLPTGGAGGGGGGGTGTSPSTGGSQYQRLVQPADSSTARLTGLKPDTTYIATLTPESNEQSFNALSVTFRTKPGGVTSSHTLCQIHKCTLTLTLLAFNFGWFYEKIKRLTGSRCSDFRMCYFDLLCSCCNLIILQFDLFNPLFSYYLASYNLAFQIKV